jgi:hypothetical protein
MKIEMLKNEFTGVGEVKGFIFKQIKSNDSAYIYEVSDGDKKHYEVIKRIISPVCINFVKKIFSETDFKEVYPKSNKFGISGFTYSDIESAIQKWHYLDYSIKNYPQSLHS